MTRRTLTALVIASMAVLPNMTTAQAFPIAPFGTEGLNILVGGTSPVIATYLGNSATFSNDLYLMLDGAGNPGDDGNLANDMFIFNNHASSLFSTVNLGSFALGTELIFRLHVLPTGDQFLTGQASRNADGKAHARAQTNWMPNETLVSFEDLYGTPEYPGGYNDLSFSFTNTRAPVTAVPEPASMALIGFGLSAIGLGAIRRRRKA